MVLIARGALVVVVLLGLALGVQTCRLSDVQARMATRTLPGGSGWTPAAPAPPKIEGFPRGKVVATAQGGVRFKPKPSASPVPCYLGDIEADLKCRVEVVDGGGRLAVWGSLVGFGQRRELPMRWAGEEVNDPGPGVTVRVSDEDGTAPVESKPPEIHVASQPRPLLWELRGGYVIPTRAVRLGVTRSLSRRFGLYMDATAPLHEGAEFDVGAGVAVRF